MHFVGVEDVEDGEANGGRDATLYHSAAPVRRHEKGTRQTRYTAANGRQVHDRRGSGDRRDGPPLAPSHENGPRFGPAPYRGEDGWEDRKTRTSKKPRWRRRAART